MIREEAETVIPTMSIQEPVLLYDQHTDRWAGANASFSVWMHDATFRAYVAAWYEWSTWLPKLPQEQRLATAVAHCQRLDYWNGCEHNYDRRVHIIYH
jgi:hypothetical protein